MEWIHNWVCHASPRSHAVTLKTVQSHPQLVTVKNESAVTNDTTIREQERGFHFLFRIKYRSVDLHTEAFIGVRAQIGDLGRVKTVLHFPSVGF